MPKTLTVQTISADTYHVKVSDKFQIPSLEGLAWLNVAGEDGVGVAIHTRNIESIYIEPDTNG